MKRIMAFSAAALCLAAASLAAEGAKETKAATVPEIVFYQEAATTKGAEFGSDKTIVQAVQDYFVKKIGVKVITKRLALGGDAGQQLNLLLASGDQLDLFVTGDPFTPGYVSKGVCAPLDDLLKNQGRDVLKTWPAQNWESRKDPQGRIIAVPRNPATTPYVTWIRKDWLDKLGLKVPGTIDELEAVMGAFADKKPGGDKTIPLLTGNKSGLQSTRTLAGAWVDSPESFLAGDGSIKSVIQHPGFREYLSKMNSWYMKGYLYKEAFIMDDAQIRALIQQGNAGVVSYWYSAMTLGLPTILKNQPDANYILVTLKGPSGLASIATNLVPSGYVINSKSKVKEATMTFLNAPYADIDDFAVQEYGIQGVDWEWQDKAKRTITAKSTDKYFFDFRTAGGSPLEFSLLPAGSGREIHQEYLTNPAKIFGFDTMSKTPWDFKVMWDRGALAAAVPTLTDLNRLINEETIKFVMGARPLSEYDQFLAQAKTVGVDAWNAEMTKQYKEKK